MYTINAKATTKIVKQNPSTKHFSEEGNVQRRWQHLKKAKLLCCMFRVPENKLTKV